MIKDLRTAYKIGFSDSLDSKIISAYHEILKWSFIATSLQGRLHRAYYRGFSEGLKIKKEVKNDLVAGKGHSDGSAVATLRSSEFNN